MDALTHCYNLSIGKNIIFRGFHDINDITNRNVSSLHENFEIFTYTNCCVTSQTIHYLLEDKNFEEQWTHFKTIEKNTPLKLALKIKVNHVASIVFDYKDDNLAHVFAIARTQTGYYLFEGSHGDQQLEITHYNSFMKIRYQIESRLEEAEKVGIRVSPMIFSEENIKKNYNELKIKFRLEMEDPYYAEFAKYYESTKRLRKEMKANKIDAFTMIL